MDQEDKGTGADLYNWYSAKNKKNYVVYWC